MNDAKRLAALELIVNQHKNLTLGLDACKNFEEPTRAMLEAILFHCRSSYKALELILEDPF